MHHKRELLLNLMGGEVNLSDVGWQSKVEGMKRGYVLCYVWSLFKF